MNEAAPAITGDSFFSCFQRDDLWEALGLAQHPATWTHVADTASERLSREGESWTSGKILSQNARNVL